MKTRRRPTIPPRALREPRLRRMSMSMSMSMLMLMLTLTPSAASAQVALPRVGKRMVSLGVSQQPGVVMSDDARALGQRELAYTHGALLVAGVHQILTTQLMMQAHLGLGAQFMDEHAAHPEGQAPSERRLALELGILARWVPSATHEGASLGAGVQLFQAWLDQAPAQLMGLELRAGWLGWADDERLVMVDLGLTLPLIQGLRLPEAFRAPEPDALPPPDWRWLRLGVTVQWTL